MIVISLFLLAMILIVCCFLPVLIIFHDRARTLTFAHTLFYLGVGMGFLGVFGMICKFAGIDMRFSVLPGAFIAIYGFKKYPISFFLPQISFSGIKNVGVIFAIAASAIRFIYIFIAGILMGTGPYPSVFLSVDTPYYLSHIHALIRYDTWPPMSLSFLDGSFGYHYGSQSICAVLSLLTGIAPHTITFILYTPIIELAIISTIWLIVGNLRSEKNSIIYWWGIPFLLYLTYYRIHVLKYICELLWNLSFNEAAYNALLFVKETRSGYPMLGNHLAVLLVLGGIYCLQSYSSKVSRIFLALLVGIAIVYKSPYFVVLLFGFGLWTLFEVLKTRRLSLLYPLLISLVVALCLYIMVKPSGDHSFVFVPFQYFLGSKKSILKTLGSLLLFASPGLLLVILLRKKIKFNRQTWMYPVAFIFSTLIFLQLFGLSRDGNLSQDIYQVIDVLPIFAALFTLSLVAINWYKFSKILKWIITTMIILLTILPLGDRVRYIGVLLSTPEQGHEYADNHMLAEALATIPISNSVIVTNDFRYPAENYIRDLRQMQFPSIFGHQTYASNFAYERYEDSDRRLDLQYRFRNDLWDPDLEIIAQEEGWTHLVIHRVSPHVEDVPLLLIFENSEYRVYKF